MPKIPERYASKPNRRLPIELSLKKRPIIPRTARGIEKNNPHLAAFLGISTGYHKRKEEEELSRKEAIERIIKQRT